VAKRTFDLIVSQEERARHSLHVSGGKADETAFEPGHQQAVDTFAVEILAPLGTHQSKSFVKLAVGVGEAREIVQFIGSKKFCGALFGTEMNESDAGAFAFDLRTKMGELGDRLAAKSSAKMPQEDQQQRAVRGKRFDGFAGLRNVGMQKLRINAFCFEHR
jgi:hypothetical protein